MVRAGTHGCMGTAHLRNIHHLWVAYKDHIHNINHSRYYSMVRSTHRNIQVYIRSSTDDRLHTDDGDDGVYDRDGSHYGDNIFVPSVVDGVEHYNNDEVQPMLYGYTAWLPLLK